VPSRGEIEAGRPIQAPIGPKGNLIYKLITTTDHKLIGIMYVVTCFIFFALAGLMALLIRAELTIPGLQFLSNEQYNQLFTMHGTAMLLFYATPVVFGFANLVMPLQIGAPDVAFPRLNALSFWLFVFGALIALGGFITPGGAADFGWTVYTPLSDSVHSPGAGADLWILGVAVGGLGTILGAVNMITTVVCMRCPGMTMFRMPIFTWNIFVTSILVILIFPLLTAALFALAHLRRSPLPVSVAVGSSSDACSSTVPAAVAPGFLADFRAFARLCHCLIADSTLVSRPCSRLASAVSTFRCSSASLWLRSANDRAACSGSSLPFDGTAGSGAMSGGGSAGNAPATTDSGSSFRVGCSGAMGGGVLSTAGGGVGAVPAIAGTPVGDGAD